MCGVRLGIVGTILNLIINTSLFLSTFLGWLIVPQYGRRWMFAIAGCGALFVWFLRKSMPESPRRSPIMDRYWSMQL